MKRMKMKGRMILSLILSLFMVLSSAVCTFAIENNASSPVVVGPFSIQTEVNESTVSITCSIENNPGNLMYGGFEISSDSSEFTVPEPQLTAGSVLIDAGMEPKYGYWSFLNEADCYFGDETTSITGSGELFTATFKISEDLKGTYNFSVGGNYILGGDTVYYDPVEVPFTIGLDDANSKSVNIGPFALQTKADGSFVSVTVSIAENPGTLTYGNFEISSDASVFSVPEPQLTAGSVLADAGMEPKCGYWSFLNEADCYCGDETTPITGNGELFTATFKLSEDLKGTYNFSVGGNYILGGDTVYYDPVEVPFTIGLDDANSKSVNIGPFTLQTKADGSSVSVTVSISENPGTLTYGNFEISSDASVFSVPEPQLTAGSVLIDAGMEPKCGYWSFLNEADCYCGDETTPITGNGELFTATFKLSEDLKGTYNFSVGGNYILGGEPVYYEPVEIPFTIGSESKIVEVSGIKIDPSNDTLVKRGNNTSLQLAASVEPENATNKSVSWSSSDPSIATVDENGQVTAKSAGEVTITATAKDGSGVFGSCHLTVTVGVTAVYYDGKYRKLLSVGENDSFEVTVRPENATDRSVSWESSDPSVVSVDADGRITAIGAGTAIITVKANDGGSETTREYVVTEDAVSDPAAKIGETEYSTLSDAVDALKGGETIVLLKDQQAGDIVLDKDCNLNLNGKTLIADSFTVGIGAKMDALYNGTLMNALMVKGEIGSLSDCTIIGGITVSQATQSDQGESHKGTIDVLENCRIEGSVFVEGEVARMDSCTVTNGIRALGHGAFHHMDETTGEFVVEPGYAGRILGLYDCTVLEQNMQSAVSASDGGQIYIFSGNYCGRQYSVYCYQANGYIEIAGGKFKSEEDSASQVIQQGSGILSDKTIVLADNREITQTPDEEGYYEVTPVAEEVKTGSVSFTLSPSDAEMTLTPNGETAPLESMVNENGSLVYQVQQGVEYTYTVRKDGYQEKTGSLQMSDQQDDISIVVTLKEQSTPSVQPSDNTVKGGDTIITGGTYKVKSGTSGIITVMTREPVTLVGDGVSEDGTGKYSDLSIDCVLSGSDLTIKDLWINNDVGQGTASGETNFGMHIVNYTGTGNKLGFEGTNLLEKQEYTQGAGIHVPKGAELTIDGSGKLYIYKYTQGSGIGGNSYEAGGTINFAGGDVFIKGSKTGSLVGGDSNQAALYNDPITISGGNLVLINKAKGAAIGSSHQGTGAGDVYLTDGNLTIISDYLGNAIGAGGNLYVSGGSFKPVRTGNSVYGNGDSATQFVNDGLVTAVKHNGDGTKDVRLLAFDTGLLSKEAETFTVSSSNGYTYQGGLHQYKYTENITYTPDNFGYDDSDKNLYFYLPMEDQTLTVNGDKFNVTWDEEAQQFEVAFAPAEPAPGSGGSGGGGTTVTPNGEITVEAGDNGSIRVDNPDAKTGETVTLRVLPKSGYVVGQVAAVNEKGEPIEVTAGENGTYTFTKPAGPVKVTVTYSPVHDETCPSKAFEDLDTSLWYHEAIDYVLEKQFFNGMSEKIFAPDGTMTRAMFVTVLSRMEGIDAAQYSGSSFTDVAAGQWYSAAIEWASQNGIVLGVGDDRFDPDAQVTREQMAAIMYRYANYQKIDTSGGDTSKFDTFTDKALVSDWAKDAMIWTTSSEIINGMGDGTLAPQSSSTRAQVAQIVMNYGQKIA